MRVERVVTNETCNQNCGFCTSRRTEEAPALVKDAGLRIRTAVEAGATELRLTGGEPTLRRDLPELIKLARESGAPRVVLHTNAAAIDDAMAARLAESGLDRCRVKIPAWGGDYDHFTDDPGSFSAMQNGVRALLGAGIRVEATIPVVAANRALVEPLPERIAETFPSIETLIVEVPADRTNEGRPLAPEAAAPVIERIDAGARRHRLRVMLDADRPLAPCLFPNPSRTAHLHALSPGGRSRSGYTHVAACAECVAEELCPGLADRDVERGLLAKPITDPRTRRRLTMISSEEEQIEREVVTREIHRSQSETFPVHTIRVQFQCNQSCHFCFVSTHLPGASSARVEAAIEEAARAGAAVAFSGGEPTLHPDLVRYVELARSAGVREIELQTNAIRLADAALTGALAQAGVDTAFVSLHGATAEVSDRVTAAPGTFARTLRGIDELRKTSIRVRLNYVFCGANVDEFPAYVEMVAARWPRITLTVSFVAPSTDLVPRTKELIPRYADVKPVLSHGIARARELGLTVTGFESMCSVPLCLLPDVVRKHLELPAIPPESDGGEFLKIDECSHCRVRDRCWGIRRGYVELYGTDEIARIP